MSVIATSCVTTYSAVQDRAVGADGTELRASIEAAVNLQHSSRTMELLQKIGSALRKGNEKDGVMLAADTFGRMIEFLSVLPPSIPLPNLVVESESEIGLDWEVSVRQVLTVTIGRTAYISYAALLGFEPVYGRVPFAGQIPETVTFLLQRLEKQSSLRP